MNRTSCVAEAQMNIPLQPELPQELRDRAWNECTPLSLLCCD